VVDVVVFHHTLGLTGPVRRFAGELRAAGHTVHTPDLYDGSTIANHRACPPLPRQNLHGKEGVSGSSPEEGLKDLQISYFCCLI
jgi:dienelactone hydrolase